MLAAHEEVLVTSREGATRGSVPTWFVIAPPGVVYLFSFTFSEKVRRWRRDPWVRLSVPGQPQLSVEGVAHFVSPDELGEALKVIRALDFVGGNLTMPHKIAACAFMHELDDNARRVGAVNTIKLENAKLRGYNTDGKGFARAIRQEFAVDLRDLRVMILGSGGAARGIAMQCAKENCERLVIANRTFEKGQQLAEELRDYFAGLRVLGPVARLQAIPLEESSIRFQIAQLDLIVNATPLGLNRSDPSPISARLLAPHLMIYDTVYGDSRTAFVSAAVEAGARAANGLAMLVHQGALAFEIWFECEAPIQVMRQAL